MGLAAPKNRTRISNDPQNTHWAGNTSRFGHRILTSQGWKPGSSLGAKDAAHSSHYTAGSHSHIRVLLKEDNLGLGAKRGSERAENFGLAGLESILGRLNGNEEEVKKEEARREEIEKRAYVYRKLGFMNFVSGGFLVGDKIEKTIKKEDNVAVKEEQNSDSEISTKKRKRDDDVPEIKEEDAEEPKLKRKKKSMNLREEAAKEDEVKKLMKEKKDKKEKSSKKDKKKDKKSTASDPEPESHSDAPTPASDPEPLTEKARRKAEKRARKEEKKLKKALKKAAKKAAKANTSDDARSDSEEEEEASSSAPTSTTATGTSTPVVSAVGLTFGAGGRHAIRQRYIRQKKMASMDPQALKEIFMIKTPS